MQLTRTLVLLAVAVADAGAQERGAPLAVERHSRPGTAKGTTGERYRSL